MRRENMMSNDCFVKSRLTFVSSTIVFSGLHFITSIACISMSRSLHMSFAVQVYILVFSTRRFVFSQDCDNGGKF